MAMRAEQLPKCGFSHHKEEAVQLYSKMLCPKGHAAPDVVLPAVGGTVAHRQLVEHLTGSGSVSGSCIGTRSGGSARLLQLGGTLVGAADRSLSGEDFPTSSQCPQDDTTM